VGDRPGRPSVGGAAASGVGYAAGAALAFTALLIAVITASDVYTTHVTGTTYDSSGDLVGTVVGTAFLGMLVLGISLLAAAPLGAVLGAGNGLLARTRVGSGWPAVVVVALVVGVLAGSVLPTVVVGGGGLVEGAGDVALGLCSGAAAAAHLRRQQRR